MIILNIINIITIDIKECLLQKWCSLRMDAIASIIDSFMVNKYKYNNDFWLYLVDSYIRLCPFA